MLDFTLRGALAVGLLLGASTSAFGQQPAEPWAYRAQVEANPSLRVALDGLFADAALGNLQGVRARFTPNTVARLEAAWAASNPPSGSWETMCAALAGVDGAKPTVVQVTLDDAEAPRAATVVISLEGRLHTLYLDHQPDRSTPWLVKVKALGVDVFDLESLDLDISFATHDPSIMEVSFGSGLGVPGEYVFRYDDDVNPSITSSLWIMVEVFARPWLRVGAIYDLPLGFTLLQVDGETVTRFVPSRLLAGVTWSPVNIDFATNSRVEVQVLTYMGATIEGEPEPVPMLGGRVALLQNAYEGADIYLGLYYQAVVNVPGLLYGFGYRF